MRYVAPVVASGIVLAGTLLVLSGRAWADFFKYRDNRGNLIITNRFEDVPKKYRNRVKVVWDKDLEKKDAVARHRTAERHQIEEQKAAAQSREAAERQTAPGKGKTLVIEVDEATGQLIRRYE